MSIAFDAVTLAKSDSCSHTASGADRYVLVSHAADQTMASATATYDGVVMTELLRLQTSGRTHIVWGLAAPATGAKTVTIANGAYYGHTSVISFTGVGAVRGTSDSTGLTTANVSATITTVSGDMVVDYAMRDTTAAISVGSSQTEFMNKTLDISSSAGGAYALAIGTSTTRQWNSGGGGNTFRVGAVALLAVSAAPTAAFRFYTAPR